MWSRVYVDTEHEKMFHKEPNGLVLPYVVSSIVPWHKPTWEYKDKKIWVRNKYGGTESFVNSPKTAAFLWHVFTCVLPFYACPWWEYECMLHYHSSTNWRLHRFYHFVYRQHKQKKYLNFSISHCSHKKRLFIQLNSFTWDTGAL